jgi:enoyl-[acyl-carrier protein] reductase I
MRPVAAVTGLALKARGPCAIGGAALQRAVRMAQSGGLLAGKRGLILGIANNRSIAWGIARACHNHGAELALTYQGDALKKRVEPLAAELGAQVVGHCDVTDPATIDAVFAEVGRIFGKLDFVVHAIAFSDKDQLTGRYVDTTADNFTQTLLISCYSLTAVAQRAEPLMTDGGSILTLTYYGAEKVMPHYNVMGVAKAALEASVRYLAVDLGGRRIRVNAVSAGPIKTLAAAGLGDFRYILKWNEYNAPLKRTVTTEEVGDAALYLLSDLSRGVTGEVHHVDSGYHVVGMKAVDAPDITAVKD